MVLTSLADGGAALQSQAIEGNREICLGVVEALEFLFWGPHLPVGAEGGCPV